MAAPASNATGSGLRITVHFQSLEWLNHPVSLVLSAEQTWLSQPGQWDMSAANWTVMFHDEQLSPQLPKKYWIGREMFAIIAFLLPELCCQDSTTKISQKEHLMVECGDIGEIQRKMLTDAVLEMIKSFQYVKLPHLCFLYIVTQKILNF